MLNVIHGPQAKWRNRQSLVYYGVQSDQNYFSKAGNMLLGFQYWGDYLASRINKFLLAHS